MVYFEVTYGEHRTKELPMNFDLYEYKEMHTWLWHKPTMNPPTMEDSKEEHLLNAYASAIAYNAAADSLSECEPCTEDREAPGGGN